MKQLFMLKQFLLVLFLVAQSSVIFAAVPDISGTYSIASSQILDTCGDLNQADYTGVITQTGSKFSMSDSFSHVTYSINGSIDSYGNITGSYADNEQHSNDSTESTNGTISGSIQTINNPLTFTIFISGIATGFNSDSSVSYDDCQKEWTVALKRTFSSGLSFQMLQATRWSLIYLPQTLKYQCSSVY